MSKFIIDGSGPGSGSGPIPNLLLNAYPIGFSVDAFQTPSLEGTGPTADCQALIDAKRQLGLDDTNALTHLGVMQMPCGYKVDLSLVGASLPVPDGSGRTLAFPSISATIYCGLGAVFTPAPVNPNYSPPQYYGSIIIPGAFVVTGPSGSGSDSYNANLNVYLEVTQLTQTVSGSGHGSHFFLYIVYGAMPNSRGQSMPPLPVAMVPFSFNGSSNRDLPGLREVASVGITTAGAWGALFINKLDCLSCDLVSFGSGSGSGQAIRAAGTSVSGFNYNARYCLGGDCTAAIPTAGMAGPTQIYPYVSAITLTPQFGRCGASGGDGSATTCDTCVGIAPSGTPGSGSGPCDCCTVCGCNFCIGSSAFITLVDGPNTWTSTAAMSDCGVFTGFSDQTPDVILSAEYFCDEDGIGSWIAGGTINGEDIGSRIFTGNCSGGDSGDGFISVNAAIAGPPICA